MAIEIPKKFQFLLIFLSLSQLLLAGVTGKIAGRVVDFETGEALVGANVIIEGTSIGSATDISGEYVILNVPPGTYILKASMIGYTNVTTTNVIVVIDLTTTINVQMQPEVLGLEEVTIVAERPLVVPDISASQFNVVSGIIETMPVSDITEVIGLQAGVQGLTVRGSSSRQTAFIVDGFVINDERSNIPYTSVSLVSIDEVQVQTGGFSSENSNLRSGVVTFITKEGPRDSYTGSLFIRYRPPGSKHFGPSVYAPDTYFTRPYLDPDICYTGSSSGAWDNYTRRQYPSFEGWNAVSETTLKDNDPSNDLTADGAKRLFEWQHRRQGDIVKPDYVIDAGLGGPIPTLGGEFSGLRFYASYRDVREMFIFPLSRDSYRDYAFRLKLTADLNTKTKLVMFGWRGETHSVSPYNWTTTPTGRILRTPYEISNLVGSSSGNSLIYMPGWYSPTTISRNIFGIKLNRVLSTKSYYNVYVQQQINKYHTYQMAVRDTTKTHEIVPDYFVDEAPFGYWWYGVTGIEGMRIGGWMNLGRENSKVSTTTLRFDYTNQINHRNLVKTGLALAYNNYDIRSFTSNRDAEGRPVMDTWNREQVYQVNPYRIHYYVSDKLEYEEFIANVGIGFDYTDANTRWYDLSDYDKYLTETYGDSIEERVPRESSKGQLLFRPHLGVSHPITEDSKLYFNYGHYLQEPSSTYRFRIQREYNGLVTSIGDPFLALERTISYELGYVHNLFGKYLLNLAAYYKDVTNQHSWINHQNINASVNYSRAASNNYEDIRGLEITVDKHYGDWVTGFINYTYMVRTSGYFGYSWDYEDPSKDREYRQQNPYQSRPHPQPYARANLDFHTPLKFGPTIMGTYPISGWNMNVLATWSAGAYSTYNPPTGGPGTIDNVQWKDRYNIDLRLTKKLQLKNYSMQIYVDVSNVLNTKYLSYSGFADNYDYQYYMESLHFSWEEGAEKGNDRVGEYRDWDVEYVPMQMFDDINSVGEPEARVLYYDMATETYMQYEDNEWVEKSYRWAKKEVLDKKAYIDMPNLTYFTFLYPREIQFGMKINF